jgi:carboxyl-terminal processing protease
MRSVVGLVILAACGGAAQPPPSARPVQPPGGQPAPSSGAQAKPAPTPAPVEPEPADPRVAADLKSFDMVWQRVAESFYDPAYGGVDWKAVRAELRPKVLETKTREEARELMNKALERLGKSHFGVSGPLDEEGEGGSAEDAGVGIEIRIIDKAAIVTRVERGSAAEQAKVKLGAELVTVEKVEVAPRLAELARKLPPSSLVPMRQARSVAKLLAGKPGTKVAVGVKTGGKVAALTLERAHVGQPASLGNLGTHRVVYEGQKLEPQIGYIRLSMFLDPPAIVPAFAKDLAAWKDAAGVIIDLRGNPGGIGGMAMGMAGHLIAEQNKKLGTMRTRQSSLDFVVNPQAQRYAGKVAVLIDEMSASTSEIFAGGLQDLGRARIFGRRSPGAALPSVIEALPNGDRFQYAIADYVSAGGKTLEGNGVTPDVPVALDLPALRGGKDPDLAAAIRWIKEKP